MDELDNYKKQGSAPSTTSTNDQTVIQMQNRIRSFMAELDKCKQNESTPGNNNLKDETMAQMSQCILSLMAEVDKHKQKEQSLRDGHEKVSHVTMVSKFLSIRQKIQGISVLPYYNMDKRLSGAITNSDEDNFFSDQYWGSLTTEDRRNRFRAKMFHIMDQCFLIAPTVGLEGYEVKEGDETVDVGLGIHLFEKPLDENKGKSFSEPLRRQVLESNTPSCTVPPDLITDWRIATMKCIDKLGYQSVLPDLISTSIYTFFQPLLSNWASEAELQAKIQELCQEALDFRLLMRRCKDFYLVKVPGENGVPLSESECDEEYVHPFGVEGGGNQASDEIAYTVFGALVKRPELGGDEERVLEPAWVIMKRA